MSRRRSLKTTQHASNSSRKVISNETTPSTVRRNFSFHINNKSIRRLKSRKSVHKIIWLTSSPNHCRGRHFISLFVKFVCVNFLSCNIAIFSLELCQAHGEYPEEYLLDLNVLFFPTIRNIFPTGYLLPNHVLTRHPLWAGHIPNDFP